MTAPEFDLNLLFQETPDWICIAEPNGYWTRVNPAVSRDLGYSPDELYAQPILSFIHPDDRERTISSRQTVLAGSMLRHFENRYVTKDGGVIWMEWTTLSHPESGRIYAIAKNVTARRELQAERDQLLQRLAYANKELERLTYTLSHDLRAPAYNFVQLLELIDAERITDPETTEIFDLLRTSADSFIETLEGHLDRMRKGGEPQVPERVDLADVLHRVTDLIGTMLTSARCRVLADFERAPKVRFKMAMLGSVLLNLITNAVRYAKPGVPPEIRLRSEAVGDKVLVTVADNGLGFDVPAVRDRLFQLGSSFHGNADSKGVGLYLVHQHMSALGGHVDVESTPGVGTTFTLTFPV